MWNFISGTTSLSSRLYYFFGYSPQVCWSVYLCCRGIFVSFSIFCIYLSLLLHSFQFLIQMCVGERVYNERKKRRGKKTKTFLVWILIFWSFSSDTKINNFVSHLRQILILFTHSLGFVNAHHHHYHIMFVYLFTHIMLHSEDTLVKSHFFFLVFSLV